MLRFCADVSAADWITRSRDATDDVASGQAWKSLALFGPPEFEAYARVRFMPDPGSTGTTAPARTPASATPHPPSTRQRTALSPPSHRDRQ
ncbi:hypothetical protein [Gordonia aichiensis]|uniref:hypothetical protein n=1 Tax=Gordonia aichiensis TaxID=36820 RepID=UPI0003085488|nr:hypothetical protein [Gordonia aichiensis]